MLEQCVEVDHVHASAAVAGGAVLVRVEVLQRGIVNTKIDAFYALSGIAASAEHRGALVAGGAIASYTRRRADIGAGT